MGEARRPAGARQRQQPIREQDQPDAKLGYPFTNNFFPEVTAERGCLSRVRLLRSSLAAISIALRRERTLGSAVIIESVNFSPELAISPIEPMVSRKCSSAEREFLAIACGQTLELKKMAATEKFRSCRQVLQ